MANSINQTVTANGNYPSDDGISWPGGNGEFRIIAGTWDGAVAKIQINDGSGWADEPGGSLSFTADKRHGFTAAPCNIRVNVASVGTSSLLLIVGRTDRASSL